MAKYFHMTDQGITVPYTPEEEAERDAEIAKWEAEEVIRQVAKAEAQRSAAYRNESDPLFFKWQAGEATEAEWQAKRNEIKLRFPDPDGTQEL